MLLFIDYTTNRHNLVLKTRSSLIINPFFAIGDRVCHNYVSNDNIER